MATNTMPVSAEFDGVDLGDQRLNRRVKELVEQLAKHSDQSFPQACNGDDALLWALYHFVGNYRLTPAGLLSAHFGRSLARAAQEGDSYVGHDTTEIDHPTSGLHLFLHLAYSTGTLSSSLSSGVVGAEFNTRAGLKPKRSSRERKQDPARESLRWGRLILSVHLLSPAPHALIHLLDREGDIYELLCLLVKHGIRFIIRVNANRACLDAEGERELLFPTLKQAQGRFARPVPLSKRAADWSPKDRKAHPAREEREAELEYSAQSITICRPQSSQDKSLPPTLTLNYVRIWEPGAPEGAAPVDWKLVTSEPIETNEQVEAVGDGYRKRWPIEELNKAIKTGCHIEETQLEEPEAVQNHLAMMLPVAWRLVQMRDLERANPEAPADQMLSEIELEVLRKTGTAKLPEKPTMREALRAIAKLGGHLKRNGPPGWITLMRGYCTLLERVTGWVAALLSSPPKLNSS